jgi:hypothetical protein
MIGRLLVLALAVAACNGDTKKAAPVGPTTAGATTGGATTGTASGAATPGPLPADQRCLWLNICDQWTGCAHVALTSSSAGTVIAAERLAVGDPVDVLDMCTAEPVCIAARGVPAGVTCPPRSTLIFIPEPDYTCAWTGSACVAGPKATP